MLARFDEPITQAAAEHDGDDSFILYPARKTRRGAADSVLVRGADYRLRPSLPRMRMTWITHHIRRGVPLSLIREIAGISTQRTFDEYVEQAGLEVDVWAVRELLHQAPPRGLRVV